MTINRTALIPLAVLAAAALAAIPVAIPAHAIPSAACQQQVFQQGIREHRVMTLDEIHAAQPAQQSQPAVPPPAGPCVPKPYIGPNGPVNANCGQTYGECGDSLLTGVGSCAGGAPAAGTPAGGGAPAAGGGTPAAGGTPGGLPGGTLGLPGGGAPAPGGAPGGGLPSDGKPVTADPQCANLDYFIKFRITCEQNGAPYPPGYTPGMNDTPPGS
jgi:hypothetical protein